VAAERMIHFPFGQQGTKLLAYGLLLMYAQGVEQVYQSFAGPHRAVR
jgi:hypothetical protein